jgi:hypothetical protein
MPEVGDGEGRGCGVAMGANRERSRIFRVAVELVTAEPAVGARDRDVIRLKLAGLHFVVAES